MFRKMADTIATEVKKLEAYTKMMTYQTRLVCASPSLSHNQIFPEGIPELKLLQGRSFVREVNIVHVFGRDSLSNDVDVS